MALATGDKLGRYEVLSLLGAGGMGEVYKARDTRLDRVVAVKVSHARFSDRFEREARAIAQLNHSNICSIYDIGPDFLVMECIAGQTLKDRIAGRAIDLREALDIVLQVAMGLQAAHARGILHRDVKPANIMITPDGQAKIMDFGLAKLGPSALAEPGATETLGVTTPGAIMGTPAYMSPEQAEGGAVDQRTDIWALGVVLYELVSGRAPFRGASPIAMLRSILDDQPQPLSATDARLPSELDRIIGKALAKNPAERYQNVDEMLQRLRALRATVYSSEPSIAVPNQKRQRMLLYALLSVAAIAAVALLGNILKRGEPATLPGPLHMEQITGFTDSAVMPALSQDGRMLTFIRGPQTFLTSGQIYVKLLPDGEPVQLTRDSNRKMSPRFSPDGSRIAYTVVTQNQSWDTWVVPVLGGEARPWLPNASGLTWTAPQRLLFSEIKGGIHMALVSSTVSRTEARDVYVPQDERGMAHHSYLSPDGKWVLLSEMDRLSWLPCRVVPFDGKSRGQIVGPRSGKCTSAAWSPDGRWVYVSSNAGGKFEIWRQRFPDGTPEQLTFGPTEADGIAMSPDGRSLVTSTGMSQQSVWVHEKGVDQQVSGEGNALLPAWGDGFPTSVFSPDGKKLYYLVETSVQRGFGSGELWVKDLENGSNEALLPGLNISSYDIAVDGQRVVFAAIDAQARSGIWLARLDRRSAPRQLPPQEGMGPVFGADNEVYFRGPEGNLWYLFAVRLDSGAVRKLIPDPAINSPIVSPDREWIVSSIAAAGQDSSIALKAYRRKGGAPITICQGCFVKWARDQRSMQLSFGQGNFSSRGHTYVIPLRPGKAFPDLPAGGIGSEAAAQKLPGIRVIERAYPFPGVNESVYAFWNVSVQRNLYRLTIP